MKIYTVIGGVNGTGKSSLTGVLKEMKSDLGFIVDIDKIAKENKLDNITAGRVSIKKIRDLIDSGFNFTQETTLSGYTTEKTIKTARDNNYFIRLYYIGLNSVEESIQRIENRHRKGGHYIMPDDVKRRFQKRNKDLLRILPYCNEAFFYDNNNGFEEVAVYKNGEIVLGENVPVWMRDINNEFNK